MTESILLILTFLFFFNKVNESYSTTLWSFTEETVLLTFLTIFLYL